MLFTLRNLGRLEEATIDLSKDLIVLTGPNNTSKTYVAHAIYGFCHDIAFSLRTFIGASLSLAMRDDGNHSEVDVLEIIGQQLPRCVEGMIGLSQESLPMVLGAPKSFTSSARIQIELTDDEIGLGKARIRDLEEHREVKGEETIIDKSSGTGVWSFTRTGILADTVDAASTEDWLARMALHQVPVIVLSNVIARAFFDGLTSPRIMIAERSAVEMFSRELAARRVETSGEDERPSPYPLAVSESLKSVYQMASDQRAVSPFSTEADHLESEILQGSVVVGGHGQMI